MGTKTFNNVKINLTLKTTDTRANLSTSSEDLAVQLGKIKKWYDDFAWSAFTAPTVEVTGSGNAVTSASWSTSTGKLTLTKGETFSLSTHTHSYVPIETVTAAGTDMDTYLTKDGWIKWNTTQGTNTPVTNWGILFTKTTPSVQMFLPDNASGLYFRRKASADTNPTAWWGFTGTAGNTYNLDNFSLNTHTHYEQDVKFDPTYSFKPTDSTRFPLTAQPLINTLRTNRFAFLPASSITIEHSTDGGSTYTDSGYSNEAKCNVFISRQIGTIKIGPNTSDERTTSMRTMITITRDSRYTRIDRFYIWFSTSGHNPYVDIQYATNAADTTWVDWRTNIQLLGWAGPNLINGPVLVFGASDTHVKKIRFIFRYAGIRANYKNSPSQIFEIAAYADYATWTATNTMMMNDHLYYWNYQQQAYFPAEIKVPTQLRIHNGNYGALFRTDGTNTHILFTNSGEALDGSYSSLRPFSINNSTGLVKMNEGLTINTKDGAFLEIHGLTTTTYTYGSSSPKIRFTNADSSQNADLIWDDHDAYCTPASLTLMGNQDGTFFCAPRIRLFSAPTAGSLIDIDDTNNKNFHLRYKSSLYGYANIISVYPGPDQYGVGVVFNNTGGGLCIIGGGESASSLNQTLRDASTSPYGTAWSYGTETMVIGADTSIYFVSGANSLTTTNHTDWTHLKTALFDTDGSFRPSIDNKGSIGTSSYKWANMYATTFNGNLTGNVTGQISVTTTNPTSATTYYGIFATAQSGINYMRANDGFRVMSLQGTTSNYGYDYLLLGNGTASGTAGNKYGGIRLYGSDTSYIQLTNGYTGAPTSLRFSHSAGTTGADFSPATTNKYDFGTSSLKWRNVYATTLNGTLNGDITAEVSKTSTSNSEWESFVPFVAKFDDAPPDDGQSVAKKPYFATDCYFGRRTYQSGSTTRRGMALVLGDPGFTSEGGIIMYDGTDDYTNSVMLYAANPYFESGTIGPNLACLIFDGHVSSDEEVSAFIPANDERYDLGHPDYKWGYVYAYNFVGGSFSGSFSGTLTGTIASATTATTQTATDSSTKVATTAHVTNKLYLAGVYYNSQSGFASAPWGKVWEYNINGTSAHRHISFILEQGYQDTNTANTLGILMVHIATNSSKEYNGGHVFWLAASDALNKDDVAVTYQGTGNCIIQIWIKTTHRYQSYHLHPLYSGVLGSASAIMGTYSSPTSGVANYSGTLIASSYTTLNNPTKMLKTIYSSRPTSANFESSNSAGMTLALATSSMTTAKPMTDGHIMNFEWDNGGKWGAQLFLPDTTAMVEYRTQSNATDWADRNWIPLLDSESGVGKDGYIAYPSDGQYTASQSSVTGALVITLPFGMTSIMLSFIVDVYNYVADTTVSYRIAGYAYASNNQWYNCTALCIGSYAGALSNLTVRFGYNGTKAQVQIGETNTVWSWPQVRVRNIMLGHTTASADKTFITNRKNWTVSFVTTNISNVSITKENTHIGKTLAASATQTGTVGGKGLPVYLNSGTITACSVVASGAWWNTSNPLVAQISASGVLEIGRYIDFHGTAAATTNYDMRLDGLSTSMLTLQSNSGTTQFNISGSLPRLRFTQTTTDQEYNSATCGISVFPGGTYGTNMVMQGGGNLYIGGGESSSVMYTVIETDGANPYTALTRSVDSGSTATSMTPTYTTEKLFITADEQILFGAGVALTTTNHTDWTHVKTALFDSDGFFRPSIDNKGQVGTSDYRWNAMYANTFVGQLKSVPGNEVSGISPLIIQNVKSTSNYSHVIRWLRGGSQMGSYGGSIGFHSTGGDTTTTSGNSRTDGAIIMVPYKTDTSPWNGTVGLYHGRYILKLDGRQVYHGWNSAGALAKTFDAINAVGWYRVISLPAHGSATSGKIISSLEITVVRNFNNKTPEAFAVRLVGLYNTTEKFNLLWSKQYDSTSQLFTQIRLVKSSDSKLLYVDLYYNSTVANGFTVYCSMYKPNINHGDFTWMSGALVTDSLTAVAGPFTIRSNITYNNAWSKTDSEGTATSYWGPLFPDGTYNSWMRSPDSGIIPYKSGGFSNPHSALGTSSWAFNNAYIKTICGVTFDVYNSSYNYYTAIVSRVASSSKTIYIPDTTGEIMVRKRTISQQNQSENIILNGQQLLYSGTGTISLGQIDVDITGLFTNWSVIMFTIIGYGFGSSGSNNKFSISGIVPLDLVKRYYEVYGSSSSSTVIVAGIQYNPSATAGNQYFYAQYVNDNKISFQCTMNGKSTSIEVYGLY